MSAEVIDLDSRRPGVWTTMFCTFCGLTFEHKHPPQTQLRYFECKGCDEQAAIEAWRRWA